MISAQKSLAIISFLYSTHSVTIPFAFIFQKMSRHVSLAIVFSHILFVLLSVFVVIFTRFMEEFDVKTCSINIFN